MARADRLARMDDQREQLEQDYRAALIAALRTTASGSWGLFDHVGDRASRARVAPVLDELAEIAAAIDALRDRLDLEPFTLHQRFLAARGRPSPSAVGEPKQAQAWLETLEATA